MTQAQIDAVNAAQQKFLAAAAADGAAQAVVAERTAEANIEHTNALVTVPQRCLRLQTDANNAYFNAQNEQRSAIAAKLQTQADLGLAQIDLQQAVLASLQTPVTEAV